MSESQNQSFASGDLIPHPSTNAPALSSHLPEPELTDTSGEPAQTSDIAVSGTLSIGTVLGNYAIEGYIGGGGMGRVYLATDTALDRKVAVKILPRKRVGEQSTVARFLNEAKSAARLNHEHIAQVYFTGEHSGIPYIVFEYVEGTNVRTLINENEPFPLPQALNYLIQVAHALAHAAEHGVVHRDVKPSNILITPEGRAKLIDMGLARLLDPSEGRDDLTASGVTLGTFDYISPEQARDPRAADIRSDIYSLGCTFFFMLAGRPPFPEGTVLQKLLQHQGDEPPDIRAFQPKIPAEAAMLIQKMMAKDPRQRFQTPAALIKALVQVAEMTGLQPAGPGKLVWVMPNIQSSPAFFRHLPWIVPVAVLFFGFFLMNLITGQQNGLETAEFPTEEYDAALPPLLENKREEKEPLQETAVRPPKEKRPLAASFYSYPLSEESLPFLANGNSVIGKTVSISVLSDSKRSGSGIGPAVRLFSRAAVPPDLPPALFSRPALNPALNPAAVNLCVDPLGETAGSYKTLSAALADAGKQAVIELKWNNTVKTEPLLFTGKNVKIVAAKGYYPVLFFEPSDTDSSASRSRNMFQAGASTVEFQDVALEMRIRPEVLAQHWSMFELTGSNKFSFVRCCLTIRNKSILDNSAYHDDAAFFRNAANPNVIEPATVNFLPEFSVTETGMISELAVGGQTAGPNHLLSRSAARPAENAELLTVSVKDSVIRGEAVTLQCDIPQEIHYEADNSLIALAKPFVQTEDSRKTVPLTSAVQIRLNRVTFFSRIAFARQTKSSSETHPLRLEVEANRSIFYLNNAPLMVFCWTHSLYDIYDDFQWSGQSNYFQGTSPLWLFRPSPSSSEGGLDYEMKLPEWLKRFYPSNENSSVFAVKADKLKFNETAKPVNQLLPRDMIPEFLPESAATEEEKKSTGASFEDSDWMPRSWTNEE